VIHIYWQDLSEGADAETRPLVKKGEREPFCFATREDAEREVAHLSETYPWHSYSVVEEP